MKKILKSLIVTGLLTTHVSATTSIENLYQKQWFHGVSDCSVDKQASVDVYAYNENSFILRQNKCDTFEAPFIYVLEGEKKIVLFDTGAIENNTIFDFQNTLENIFGERLYNKQIIIVHSHGHADHVAGDSQLVSLANSFVMDTKTETRNTTIELGNRNITIIPSPGHHKDAVALYDSTTQWLLTGDTLYPGLIYVKNWREYRESIAKLVEFSTSNSVSAILGGHIETNKLTGEIYPIGTTYQPHEAPLPLTVNDLKTLHSNLQKSEEAKEIKLENFTVMPMNFLQRTIVNIANLFFN